VGVIGFMPSDTRTHCHRCRNRIRLRARGQGCQARGTSHLRPELSRCVDRLGGRDSESAMLTRAAADLETALGVALDHFGRVTAERVADAGMGQT